MTKKIFIYLLCVAVILLFSACAASENDETTAATKPQTIAESSLETADEPETELTEKLPPADENEITEDEAKDIAYAALKEEYPKGNTTFGIDYTQFAFKEIERCGTRDIFCAFNTGYSAESYNTGGHPYYAVSYTDTTQIAGFAYFCVDLKNGDLLFSGYMGD